MRQFNTAGPSVAIDHYCVDPLSRIGLDEILELIEAKRYFVLHAPRQTGKTTCLLALMNYLNTQGHYRAAYANIETAQTARNDVSQGLRAVCGSVAGSVRRHLGDNVLEEQWLKIFEEHGPNESLRYLLEVWTKRYPSHPTVLLLDEIDALVGDTLISVLRQIRSGYIDRPLNFPTSIILCGVRDVRDYRIHSGGGEIITGGSAFNIKAESIRVGNFTRADIVDLYGQHTAETGQRFEDEIFAKVWDDTAGQPWLVNALAREACFKLSEGKVRSRPIDLELYLQAREQLISSRATHLDQLTDKLREERVHRVIAAVLAGETTAETISIDDLQYVQDMGLVTLDKQVCISNAIYREVIPRELTWTRQMTIAQETCWYVTSDKRLDMSKLLRAFQQFFRENADAWIERFQYKEAGPHLLLQAFLQRIVNGGGRITREYGLGMKRMDLYLEWPLDEALAFRGPLQRVVLELKVRHKALEVTIAEGVEQTASYSAACGADEAHLIIFERSSDKEWDDRIWERSETVVGRAVKVWGM
ncbi:MAG: AAA-like domain-containing protein [Desulfuromonadales bacterium]